MSLKKTTIYCSCTIIFLLVNFFAFGQTIAINKNLDVQQNISKNISIYEDKSSSLTLNHIITNNKFKTNKNNIANFGITNSTIWIKIVLFNPFNQKDVLLEIKNSTIDSIILFSQTQKNAFNIKFSGLNTEITKRDFAYQTIIFKLNPNSLYSTYYLKIKSANPITLPVYLGNTKSTFESVQQSKSIFSLYIGLIISMFLYNIFIYFTVKDKSYLYYVFYIFSVGFTQLSLQGYSYVYFWKNNLWLNNQGIVLSIALVGIASLLFVKEFLHIKNFFAWVNKYFNILILIYLILFIVSLFGFPREAQNWLQILTLIASMSVISIGIVLSLKNNRSAIYFTIAWSCFLIGVVIFILKDVGVLAPSLLTNNAILISSGLEAILLSLALADKINIFKKEKEDSQAEALRISLEKEKLILEQNTELEKKVNERTQELKTANTTLEVTLTDLKETQSQLVEQEKMASLGQLTAGIAHEINNPINFVTSNIKPLELDIIDLENVISMYEKLNPDEDIASQIANIESFKKKIDIEFVRNEMKSLLNGIGEGARRTAEIIRSLKNFSRLDENDTKPVNLNEGLTSTLVLVKNTLPEKLTVITEFGDIPNVECMPGKINQVFMNLITNAIYAIKANPVTNTENFLTIKTWQEEDLVKVSIKDTGIGMSEEVKNKVFEPFFTTKDIGEGTGLGLSIVFSIIEKHKGKIEVNSKVGEGTEFIITLHVNTP